MTTTPNTNGCPVTHAAQRFDPYAEDYLQDPSPHLRAIREQEPVFYAADLDYWVVSRYEDVKHCFMDQDTFSAAPALDTIVPPYPSTLEILSRYKLVPDAAMVNADPPGHRPHRKQCLNDFSSHRMRRMAPFIREIATGFIDTFVKNGNADLVAELFYEFPALVVFKFFGIPDDEVEEVKTYAGSLALFNWGKPTEAEQNRLAEMVGRYYEYSPMLFDPPHFHWDGPPIEELKQRVWPDFHLAKDLEASDRLVSFLSDEIADAFALPVWSI